MPPTALRWRKRLKMNRIRIGSSGWKLPGALWRPAISGECNGCEDKTKNGETQKIKDQPGAGPRSIGGNAKPDQHGRRQCGLGRGSAWAFSRQAFLIRCCNKVEMSLALQS